MFCDASTCLPIVSHCESIPAALNSFPLLPSWVPYALFTAWRFRVRTQQFDRAEIIPPDTFR